MTELYPQEAYQIAEQMRSEKASDDAIRTTLTNEGLTAYQIEALMADLNKAVPRRRSILQRPDMKELLIYIAGGSLMLFVGLLFTTASYTAAVNDEERTFRIYWWVIIAGAFLLLMGIAKLTSNRE